MPAFAHPLLGKWVIDDSDDVALAKYGQTSMDFRSDGSLVYTIHCDEVDQKMFLSYRIQGSVLITDQPSSPKMARSEFMFDDDGRLVLFFDGVPSFYRRCEEEEGCPASDGRSDDSDDS